jgi:hypothetical protein
MGHKLDKYREWVSVCQRTPVSQDLRYLPEYIQGRDGEPGWNLSPDYQRDHVWTQRQKELFVGHYLEGGLIPPIYVQRYEGPQHFPEGGLEGWLALPCEVIDGKQRLQALLDWIEGKIEAEVTCGDRIKWSDLDIVDKRGLPDVKVDLSRIDRLRFYLRLNRGGSIHTDAEIDKVRSLLKTAEGK